MKFQFTDTMKRSIFILVAALMLIGLAVLFYHAFNPMVDAIEKTRADIAGRNAFSTYLNLDNEHVMHAKDVVIVHNNYYIYVSGVSYKDAELQKLTEIASFVHIGKPLEEGTYESGVYVEEVSEKTFVMKKLNPGDSLVGLRIATEFESIPGYTYYGTFENCDVYERK